MRILRAFFAGLWFLGIMGTYLWHGHDIINTGLAVAILGTGFVYMLPDLWPLLREFLLLPLVKLARFARNTLQKLQQQHT